MSRRRAIEYEQEDDGRWIAEIPVLPGVMAYGDTLIEAIENVLQLAAKVEHEREKLWKK